MDHGDHEFISRRDGQVASSSSPASFFITNFPDHLIDYLFDFFSQETTVSLLTANRHLHYFAARKLYRKIYLSDCTAAVSDPAAYNASALWSVLKVPRRKKRQAAQDESSQAVPEKLVDDVMKITADALAASLDQLVTTFETSRFDYVSYVEIVSLEMELGESLEKRLMNVLMNNGKAKSIRRVENIYMAETMYMISESPNRAKLQSLSVPPPNPLPTSVRQGYLDTISNIFETYFQEQHYEFSLLTVFADPVTLFNRLRFPERWHDMENCSKIQVESLMYHVRDDRFTHTKLHNNFQQLTDIIDKDSLKTLIVTCWIASDNATTGAKTFPKTVWEGFTNLEDVSFISMIVNDKMVTDFLESYKNRLKRFRFHYKFPRSHPLNQSSDILQGLIKNQSKSLRYLDINYHDDNHQFYWYNVFESKIEFHDEKEDRDIACFCKDCLYTKQEIVTKKLFDGVLENVSEHEYYLKSTISMIFLPGLIPHTFSFDKYPSFADISKIDAFLKYFNSVNQTDLTIGDFRMLYQTLVHHMRLSLRFFIDTFPKLQRVVLNDIPFVIVEAEKKIRTAKLVFPLSG